MKRTLRDAATVVGGQLVGDDRPYGAVATDSRTLQPGSLFVALRGPTFDGGDFVAAAAASAPGSITPTTGTWVADLMRSSASAVAVLQATTSIWAP